LESVPYSFDLANLDIDFRKLNDTIKNERSKNDVNKLKAIVVINPNNPTGGVHKRHMMEEIVKFCVHNSIVLISSEVLQDTLHSEEDEFTSFRKVVMSMPSPYNKLELFSYHSASKAKLFNCAARSGFLDVLNVDESVQKELYKHISMDICSAVPGQIMLDLTFSTPETEIFGESFVNRFNESISASKKIHREMISDVSSQLAKCDLFNFKTPQAGFTFFIELKNEKKYKKYF